MPKADLQFQIKEDHLLLSFTQRTDDCLLSMHQAFHFEGLLRLATTKIPKKGLVLPEVMYGKADVGVQVEGDQVVLVFDETDTIRLDEEAALDLANKVRKAAQQLERIHKRLLKAAGGMK